MKKFFTLIAGMLLIGSSAFAQSRWTNILPVNTGDMETALPAYETTDQNDPDAWNPYWVHEFPTGEVGEEQFQGTATIVEDPANPQNHCARVVARSEEVARAAENIVEANGALASWDCQFFIYAPETVPEGKMIKMTIKVKAEKAGSFETQAHYEPGNYNHYVMFGNINVTTDWQTIEVETTLSADMCQEANDKFFQSVAFNLSTDKEGNVFYFDDIKLEIMDKPDPQEFKGWFNMLRHGTASADKIGSFTSFTGRDGIDGVDKQARMIDDPVDGQPALTVASIGPMLDENGEPIFRADGAAVMRIEDTDSVGIDDWQTQFFVTGPHAFSDGEKFRLKMYARADKPCTVQTQVHNNPGGYIYWQAVGDLNLTEEWQEFEFDDIEVSTDQKGFNTIAFNCNVLKEENNYYFRFDEFCANEADVTDKDRTLATEALYLPVPDNSTDIANVMVDMSQMVETLEVEDLKSFINDESLKVKTEEGFTDATEATMGVPIDANGFFTESLDNSIIIGLNDEAMGNNSVLYEISNTSAGLGTNTIATKFAFVNKDGWYYIYDITLVDAVRYPEVMGISDMNMAQKNNGIIYDLQGRKLNKAVKGLYIVDGKKFFKK